MLRLEGKEQRQIDTAIESLDREFEGRIPTQTVHRVSAEVLDHLLTQARLPNYVPVLTRRYTREQLLRQASEER